MAAAMARGDGGSMVEASSRRRGGGGRGGRQVAVAAGGRWRVGGGGVRPPSPATAAKGTRPRHARWGRHERRWRRMKAAVAISPRRLCFVAVVLLAAAVSRWRRVAEVMAAAAMVAAAVGVAAGGGDGGAGAGGGEGGGGDGGGLRCSSQAAATRPMLHSNSWHVIG